VVYVTTLLVALNGRMNNELERVWKETVLAQFSALSQYSKGGTEKNTKNLSQDCRSPGRDLNKGPPEFEARMLTSRPQRSALIIIINIWLLCCFTLAINIYISFLCYKVKTHSKSPIHSSVKATDNDNWQWFKPQFDGFPYCHTFNNKVRNTLNKKYNLF
jgi:hypothetical protein